MRSTFIEEHNRGRKVLHATSGMAPACSPMGEVVSGVEVTVAEADSYVAARFIHDQQTVAYDLQEEALTERFITHRTQAWSLIRGTPSEGPNSDRLPLMDYKRAVDRVNSSSEEWAPPVSGSAPGNG